MHSEIALELLALVAATALLVWGHRDTVYGKWVKGVSILVMIVAILSLVCSGYHAVKCGKAGWCPYGKSSQGWKAGCSWWKSNPPQSVPNQLSK